MKKMNVLLGITGGIAAYKIPELIRRLREKDASVQVVLTKNANKFVTETTLQALSGRRVRTDLWDNEAEASMSHIELARWAECVIVAPATAEFLSRLAAGSALDLLSTLCLATQAPLMIAPSMNHVMWKNQAVQDNCSLLKSRGTYIIGPGHGEQACGEIGYGRMAEPLDIIEYVLNTESIDTNSKKNKILKDKRVLVTAGPTREAIDPVRFVSNRSSGKMGYAIARVFAEYGASVLLISGPVNIEIPTGVECIKIESAEELYKKTHQNITDIDIFVGTAAVADYRPKRAYENKIKKSAKEMILEFEKSPDILASVSKLDSAPFTVGFAAETQNLKEHAKSKLKSKNLDMIIANEVGKGSGFDQDENAVNVFWSSGERSFEKTQKYILANKLVSLITETYMQKKQSSNVLKLPKASQQE